MACINIYGALLDVQRVQDCVSAKYGTTSAFIGATCLCRQTYYRWIKRRCQPPIGFYILLASEFGGGPMDYAMIPSRPAAP